MADGKQWRIQNLPGVANPIESPNPLFSIIFAENCMKMEKTRLTGAHVPPRSANGLGGSITVNKVNNRLIVGERYQIFFYCE